MTIGLYAIVNKVDGRTYIGSSKNVELRLINQKSFMKTKHPCMIAALKDVEVNIDDFDFLKIAKTETIDEARELETAFLECFWGDWLYNRSPHANGSTGVKRNHAIYSAGAKKQWSDPEQREKKIAAMRGKREVVICPHCGKSGGGGNMRRYHFDRCKNANQS